MTSVTVCTIKTAPPFNSPPCNPAVLNFNELLQHLILSQSHSSETDSSQFRNALSERLRGPWDCAKDFSAKHTEIISKMV